MSDIPSDLVLLAQLWECPHTDEFTAHPGEVLVSAIEREFQGGMAVYGKKTPLSMERVRLRPVDCEINWIGPPGTTDYRPCAEPILDLRQPALLNRIQERYYDLAIARNDWDRLLDEAMGSLGFVNVDAMIDPVSTPVVPTRPRRGTEQEICAAVKQYIVAEDRTPNMDRAVEAVLATFPAAGRDRVRDIYRGETGHKDRGRPSKSRQ